MPEYVKAEWGIPHCKFSTTATGFKVEYRAPSHGAIGGVFALDKLASGPVIGILFFFVIFPLLLAKFFTETFGDVLGLTLLAFVVGFAFTWIVRRFFRRTIVEVTREAVLINDKPYDRKAFGAFHILNTIKLPGDAGVAGANERASLGFNYGSRSLPLPGMWPAAQATEFVASLNQHYRKTPKVGDEHAPSAEKLRAAAQSSDF